ncbi:TetR/AcrR family transcriptional regulator [Actinomadura atramentaria]|uniref:TetR/AcrR family transcriptional regulator n=1 Tax=Actinomadura atramentaria TaxID=1990 RepID=UPI000361B1CE|nr:TetR/AcrR family transcriptional regulator [Actinomadura atramentaria]
MSARTGTKGVPRPEREAQILAAAGREFGTRGHAGASVSRIAAASDVSKPLVYSYFGSREQLHLACVRAAGDRLVAAVRAAEDAAPDAPAADRAARTLNALITALDGRRTDWHVLYDPTLPPPETDSASAAARRYRAALNGMGAAGVADVLARAGDTDPDDGDLLTRIWFATVTAVVRWWDDHPDRTAAELTTRCTRLLTTLRPDG